MRRGVLCVPFQIHKELLGRTTKKKWIKEDEGKIVRQNYFLFVADIQLSCSSIALVYVKRLCVLFCRPGRFDSIFHLSFNVA